MLQSHNVTNQLIDLHCKSIDWFLHSYNTGLKWVKDFDGDIRRTTNKH